MKIIGKDVDEYVKNVGLYDRYRENDKPAVYFLGLMGEAGELCLAIDNVNAIDPNEDIWKNKVIHEIGDIFWYWFGLTKNLNLNYTKIWNQLYTEEYTSNQQYGDDYSTEILRIISSCGRVIEHFKKSIRDDNNKITPERLKNIEEKLVETLSHLFLFCKSIDADPYQVLQMNYEKLFKRNEAGTLQGEGDGITKEERK